jgi:catechol 2,3-dioxygenase-like lactoylglutathione lyase family enzyme
MASRLTEVIVDCHDLDKMVRFWCAVLGYVRVNAGDGWVAIGPPGERREDDLWRASPQPPFVAFVQVPEDKSGKNRVHLDVTPFGCSQSEEVDRLTRLGASETEIGQQGTPWIVMADPEGNEFCVMPALD